MERSLFIIILEFIIHWLIQSITTLEQNTYISLTDNVKSGSPANNLVYLEELFRFWKNFYVHFFYFYVKNILPDRTFFMEYYDFFFYEEELSIKFELDNGV